LGGEFTWLQRPGDEKGIAALRLSTHRGRPLGSDSFVSKLEKLIGHRLGPLPVGRPRKTKPKHKTTQEGSENR